MVTSAIFAPNPIMIMNDLYSSNLPISNDNLSPTNRSISSSTPVSSVHYNQTRLHAPLNPIELFPSTTNNNENIYVIVTADSKGQLKLLVNRFHRS